MAADGGAPAFAAAVLRVATAQITHSVGFRAAEPSALNTLAGVLAGYLQSLAREAAGEANTAGRTHCNLIDVAAAIDQLRRRAGGYPGAWDHRRGWATSLPLREIRRFVRATAEIPFAQPILRREYPAVGGRKSFWQLGVAPPARCVPAWLPAFPHLTAEEEPEIAAEVIVCVPATLPEKNKDLLAERQKVRFRVGPIVGGSKRRRWRDPPYYLGD